MKEQLVCPIKVVLADDNQRIRKLVREVLKLEEGLEVCDEANSLKDAVSLIGKWQADILVLDILIHEYDREDLFWKEIGRLSAAGAKIVILSAHAENDYSAKCLQAGACGYVSKDKILSCLATAIRNVYSGDKFVSGPQ